VEYILDNAILLRTKKSELSWSPFHNIGVEHPDFKNLAGKFSDVLFDRFHQFAKGHLRKGYPLLIAGGCGLNCEWNTKWKETKLFADVFVPPVANDTGSAIGTAVDAQYFYTKNAKVSWDVYSGPEFVWDVAVGGPFKRVPFSHEAVARFLADGNVLAWVQGKCEIGPRALGNRSILAAPFEKEMQARLNIIKQREQYRPIAPVCLEEDVSEMFDWQGPSPYMLYFQNVKSERLKAITHVDNSARVQTVNCFQNEPLYDLLKAFKAVSGFGVLCNTSLNFSGRGFINRISDLVRYVQERELDGFVVENEFYTR
jgi:hydroxymethyl cephem carbamoyltransferase